MNISSTRLLLLASGSVILGFFVFGRGQQHRLPLSACFEDVRGLSVGATGRTAGENVGRVTAVRAQPNDHSCLGRVDFVLVTSYELKIPRASTVHLAAEGLLETQYLAIDTR